MLKMSFQKPPESHWALQGTIWQPKPKNAQSEPLGYSWKPFGRGWYVEHHTPIQLGAGCLRTLGRPWGNNLLTDISGMDNLRILGRPEPKNVESGPLGRYWERPSQPIHI